MEEKRPALGEFETDKFEKEDVKIPLKRKKKCASCGRVLLPNVDQIVAHGKKTYCEECYQRVIKSLEEQSKEIGQEQREKQKFWDYVKECYGIEEIPDWWNASIAKIMKDDPKKKWGTLRFTLWYMKNVLFLPFSAEYGISFIKNYYNSARDYYKSLNETMAYNRTADIEPTKIERVKVDSPKNNRPKPKVRMEDL